MGVRNSLSLLNCLSHFNEKIVEDSSDKILSTTFHYHLKHLPRLLQVVAAAVAAVAASAVGHCTRFLRAPKFELPV